MVTTAPDSRRTALRRVVLVACLLLTAPVPAAADVPETAAERLSAAALARTAVRVTYDPAYVRLAYPGGDVPADRGVCADVIVRAYRAGLGVDLQQRVHEDMTVAFAAYPRHWGLSRPDSNIDHRRVPNLETFLKRQGAALPVTRDAADYRAGDVVAWNLRGNPNGGGFLPHIGIVTDRIAPSGRPLVVHNIGAGPKPEDVLFAWPITGHYRWLPAEGVAGAAE